METTNKPSKTISDFFVFQRGSIWWYGWRKDGQLRRWSAKTESKKEAEKKAAEAHAKALHEAALAHHGAHSNSPASVCFALYRQRKLKDKSLKNQRLHDNFVRRFAEFFPSDPPLASLSKFQVEDFRDHLKKCVNYCAVDEGENRWKNPKCLSVKTVREILVWLRAVCRYSEVVPNPVEGVSAPKEDKEKVFKKAVRFYSTDEEKRIFRAAEQTVFELPLKVLWHTGLRPAELKYMKNDPEHIDRKRQIITVIDKKSEVRSLDLGNNAYTRVAWDALLAWIEKRNLEQGNFLFPQSPNWFSRRWRTVLGRAGLPYVMLHQVRHQFVRHCFHQLGWDLTTISQWCGHSTDMCYQTYSKVLIQSPKSKASKGGGAEKKKPVVLSPERKKRLEREVDDNPLYRENLRYMAEAEAQEAQERSAKTVTISREEYEELLALVKKGG